VFAENFQTNIALIWFNLASSGKINIDFQRFMNT